MTSVIFAGTSGEVNTNSARTVTLNQTPLSTDALLLVYSGGNSFAGMAVSGAATWGTPAGISSTGISQFFALGTSPTGISGDAVTVTNADGLFRQGSVDLYIIRGLTSVTMGTPATATAFSTTLAGPSQTANADNAVIGVARGKTGMTWPSSQSPAGAWTNAANNNSNQSGYATPSATAAHSTSLTTPSGGTTLRISQVIVTGTPTAPGTTTGTVSAMLPAISLTASIAGTTTVPPTTGTVAGVLPAVTLTASIAGAVAGPSGAVTGTLAATLPVVTLTASIQGATGDPYPESMTFGIGIGLRIEQTQVHPVDPRTNRVPVRLVVVNQSGAVVTELDRVEMDTLEEPLKDDDKFSFTLSTSDPKAIHAMPRNGHRMPEVQLWRGSVLMSWLVVLPNPQQSDDGSRITFQCADVSWYFSQLSIDRRPRLDLLRNGGFATGNIDWWVAPNSRLLPVFQTWSVIDVPEARSGKGVRLTGMGSALSKGYIRQRRRFTQPVAARYAMPVVVSGRVRLSPDAVLRDDGWVIHVLVHNTINNAVVLDDDTLSYEQKVKTFNDKYALDRFHDVSVEVEVPANGIEHLIEVRLYSPKTGYADFVDFEMVPAEEFAYFNLDQGHIFKHLIEFAQLADYGKDDLNIIGRTRRTGVYRAESIYPFDEHRSVMSAIQEEMSKYRGADWDVHYYPGEGIRQAAISYPRMGGASGMMFELGGHMVGYKVIGGPLSNSVVVQGLSLSGAARKEAYAIDPGKLGGMVLESTFTAEDGTPVRDLQDVADYALRSYGVPVPSLRVQMNPRSTSELIDRVGKGDVVRVVIHDGLTNVDGNYRIVRRYFDPNTDTLEYDLAQEV